jgi:intracellular sulfur oxidation DsrE/DsrF family protein
MWSIWDNRIQFDMPTQAVLYLQLQHYQSLVQLSATNLTNFLTDRHPHLLRVACEAQAADFMKDTEEYNKAMQRLGTLVERVQAEDDLQYRGADLETWNPGNGR